jgi:polar amino acid transport system permease protein
VKCGHVRPNSPRREQILAVRSRSKFAFQAYWGSERVTYQFQFRDVAAYWPSLLVGVATTLMLSLVSMAGGLLVGILGAAARLYGPRPLRLFAAAYVEAIRNTPLLVQLFIVFFGLAQMGLRLEAPIAAIVALIVNVGAYATEIVRAGLEAIPRPQVEAGHALGLSGYQVFRHVVLVPALKLMFPALASQFTLLLLATSVASLISVDELFHTASIIQSRTFRDFEVYTIIGLVYLTLALFCRAGLALIYRGAFGRR